MKTTIQRAIKILERSHPHIKNGIRNETLANDIKCFLDKQPVDNEIQDINFIKWYSGMDEKKIRNAFKRYKIEVLKPINQL